MENEIEFLRDELTRVEKERDKYRDTLDRFRLVIEEATIRPPSCQFVMVRDEERWSVPADHIEGVFKAILKSVKELGDWSAYRKWQKYSDEDLERLEQERDWLLSMVQEIEKQRERFLR